MESPEEYKDLDKYIDFLKPGFIGNQIFPSINVDKQPIVLGIAIMDKKLTGGPLKSIFENLLQYKEIKIIVLEEKMLLHQPVETWPKCDALISFFSGGFPFTKVLRYVYIHKPYMFNNLYFQRLLWDRRTIYGLLKHSGIRIPLHLVLEREKDVVIDNDTTVYTDPKDIAFKAAHEKIYRELCQKLIKLDTPDIEATPNHNEEDEVVCEDPTVGVVEYENSIEINKRILPKAFVEKPINAEDHNINIYYPTSLGGGHKKLFRKTDNLSSKFFPQESRIRTDGSYIYEEYLQTDGFDIKVYTVGNRYAHAEARKSPTLDGKVMRDAKGKEVRYPIIMSPEEKEISRTIAKAFKQQVCGFDLLRANGKSYVCDVNGWSFVKGNAKYYSDCTHEIIRMILQRFCPAKVKTLPLITASKYKVTYPMFMRPPEKIETKHEELRSVVALFRHGDRTPKQKMKLLVTEPEFLEFFQHAERNGGGKIKQLKMKSPKRLEKLLENVKLLLKRCEVKDAEKHKMDRFGKLFQLKAVLEKGGHFDGIYRKVQMKPIKTSLRKTEDKEEMVVEEALLVLKWGGELTHAGIQQAETLGKTFRVSIYPSSKGMGLLRLHSTYRHDLKCYSSDEGRCMMTAASFLKGLLDLDGELPPILNSMVISSEESQELLEHSEEGSGGLKVIKNQLKTLLNSDGELSETYQKLVGEAPSEYMGKCIEAIGNPLKMLAKIYALITEYTLGLQRMLSRTDQTESYLILRYPHPSPTTGSIVDLTKLNRTEETKCEERRKKILDMKEEDKERIYGCEKENLVLIFKRWKKLEKDFYSKKLDRYDISKIPDVNDGIRYDALHNNYLMNETMVSLCKSIRLMNEFVTPLEFGFTTTQKVASSVKIAKKLLKKIRRDLLWSTQVLHQSAPQPKEFIGEHASWSSNRLDASMSSGLVNSAWRHVRTRLYFTSASHLYAIFNALTFGLDSMLLDKSADQAVMEELKAINILDYLSYVVIRLFEDLSLPSTDPKRFRLELAVSPGSNFDPLSGAAQDHTLPIRPLICINKKLTLDGIRDFFEKMIHMDEGSPCSPLLYPLIADLTSNPEEKPI